MQANGQISTLAGVLAPPRGLPRLATIAVLVAAGSAVVAGAAQFRIDLPFTPVPITGQTFAVLLVGALLGSRLGAGALTAYMLEGSAGLLWGSKSAGFKVFAGGAQGWETIAGPTGGYIIGFIFAAFVVGWLAERGFARNPLSAVVAMATGNVIIYVFGLPWLAHFVPDSFLLEAGLYPFIVGDAGKLLLAASLMPMGWAALRYVPGYESALPTMTGEFRFGQYRLPLRWLYLVTAALLAVGTVLPWGLPGGGHDIGVSHAPGQVAVAAAGAAVALAILPRPTLGALIVTLVTFGILLPFEVLPDEYVFDRGQASHMVALAVGLIGMAALAVVALPKMTAKEAMRLGQYAVGAIAASACFIRFVHILEASRDFTPGDLGAGLFLAALAAVLLVALSLLDRPQQEPT